MGEGTGSDRHHQIRAIARCQEHHGHRRRGVHVRLLLKMVICEKLVLTRVRKTVLAGWFDI